MIQSDVLELNCRRSADTRRYLIKEHMDNLVSHLSSSVSCLKLHLVAGAQLVEALSKSPVFLSEWGGIHG